MVRLWSEVERSKTSAALATLVQVSGSHYRKPGARMLITDDDRTVGAISAGCLESDLRERAYSVMKSGTATLVRYDTTTDEDLLLGTGMGCGGVVDLLLESTESDSVVKFMQYAARCIQSRSTFAVATAYRTQNNSEVRPGDRMFRDSMNTHLATFDDVALRARIMDDLDRMFSSGESTHRAYPVTSGQVELFLERISPPLSLLLLGAGDDTVPVVQMAKSLGWQVAVADHRREFVRPERFPEADLLVVVHAEDLTDRLPVDSFDAAVVMTHSYFQDRELFKRLVHSKLKYLGLLGAAGRAKRLLDDLRRDGVEMSEERLARLYAPVGLDIAAEGPHEIALSVVSEIQQVLAGGTGRSLRDMYEAF